MGKPINDLKVFKGSGMDKDSAIEDIAHNDAVAIWNMRFTGTGQGEDGYASNPESTQLITISTPNGVNKGIGGGSFEEINLLFFFRYNSGGNNQICTYNNVTKVETVIYEDLTNSGGIPLLPLDPRNFVHAILVNKTYAIWVAKNLEVGYVNLQTLISGGYGTVLAEDLSLIKPQGLAPITGVYGSDTGKPANYLFGKLPQFIYQYESIDFNKSAWSTRSKRIVPYQQNTPTLGSNVSANNYIIVSVNIGSIRVYTLNIACQFDDSGVFSIIKTVDRSYIVALPNTSVSVSTEVYEAYNPATNIYQFVFYNNTVPIPVAPTETDLAYDYVWPSNAVELINDNLIGLGDFTTLYTRPKTSITIKAVSYNPNISIPANTNTNPLKDAGRFAGAVGSGAGNHKRVMFISLSGVPVTGDIIIVVTADIRNSNSTKNYGTPYVVPITQNGNLAAVSASLAQILGGSYSNSGGVYTVVWIGDPYFELQQFNVQNYYTGPTVANSIPTIVEDTNYQAALAYIDKWGRYMPLDTDNTFMVITPSKAQVSGNALLLSWQILNAVAPVGAVRYQWLITKPPVNKILDTIGALITYKGTWDASTNTSPALSINSGNVGDTYQITNPATPTVPASYHNIGDGSAYKTGDYVTNTGGSSGGAGKGLSYTVLPKSFGNLATTGTNNILAISLNSLNLLNSEYSDVNVNTNLVYSYAAGDRCTFHYWIDAGVINYFNAPYINLAVLGYDAGTGIVKLENSAALTFSGGHILYNGHQIDAKNIFLRLYSPAPQVQSASTAINDIAWYEIGESFTITNGSHDVLSGSLYDGGAYYKTRQFPDGIAPYSSAPVAVLATDINYSDFYYSNYHSFGRVRTYYDELESTERQASIITSQVYISGSRNNGLNRFYPADIYGEGNGQTSSSKGAIQFMWQRGNVLIVGQERGIFYIPVNEAYQILNDQLTGIAISEKLLNHGRYDAKGIGIGTLKESFCFKNDVGYIINPFNSLPYEITLGGVEPIAYKMSQYFRDVISLAYSQGKKIVQFYHKYYDEVMVCIETDGGILTFFPFDANGWNPFNNYVITGTSVTATPNGANSVATYNSTTGKVTYTPTTNYVGSDVATFTFLVGGNPITLNNCLNWTAGVTTVNPFSFAPQINKPLSTQIISNQITVSGNNIAVPISITGGQYSVNGGAFTSAAGTVNLNDTVQVEVLSSGSNSTATSCTLTISGTSATFTATTLASGGTSVTLSMSATPNSGAFDILGGLSAALTNDLTINYYVQYNQGGFIGVTGTLVMTIPLGTTIKNDLGQGYYDMSLGTPTSIVVKITSVSPNPNGTATVIY